MKARVSNLAKAAKEWPKLNFTPLLGELIIYLPDESQKAPSIKIGDGVHTLQELPFVIESLATTIIEKYQRSEELDAGRITNYF